MTRAEYEAKYGAKPSVAVPAATAPAFSPVRMTHQEYLAKYGGADGVAIPEPKKSSFLESVATGLGTSLLKTAKGIGDLVGLKPTKFGERLLESANTLDEGTVGKKLGKFTGDVAQIAAPVSKVGTILKAAPAAARIGAKALTAGSVVAAQEGEVGAGSALAGATEVIAPGIGKVLKPVVTRLAKSLASGLSGVSSKAIESIAAEGKFAKEVAKQVDTKGTSEVIKKNAETIINGVSKIKKEARARFGSSLGALKAVDINPKKFRSAIQPVLSEVGSVIKSGKRVLTKAEFESPAMLKKANTLVNKLSTTKLDGLSLRNTLEAVENARFRTTGSDPNRLAFNAFITDLSSGIRKAIGESTDKLGEINKAFSTDMQLAEAVEDIFGGVKFKNLSEILKVSKNLETLFAKKGIAPEVIDDFLTRVGVSPSEFRASEAVRGISDVGSVKNTEGLTIAEMVRGLTSAVVTPKAVRYIAIQTGLAEESLLPILQKLSVPSRATFIRLLAEIASDGGDES